VVCLSPLDTICKFPPMLMHVNNMVTYSLWTYGYDTIIHKQYARWTVEREEPRYNVTQKSTTYFIHTVKFLIEMTAFIIEKKYEMIAFEFQSNICYVYFMQCFGLVMSLNYIP